MSHISLSDGGLVVCIYDARTVDDDDTFGVFCFYRLLTRIFPTHGEASTVPHRYAVTDPDVCWPGSYPRTLSGLSGDRICRQ